MGKTIVFQSRIEKAEIGRNTKALRHAVNSVCIGADGGAFSLRQTEDMGNVRDILL